jgi:hypothetical protein
MRDEPHAVQGGADLAPVGDRSACVHTVCMIYAVCEPRTPSYPWPILVLPTSGSLENALERRYVVHVLRDLCEKCLLRMRSSAASRFNPACTLLPSPGYSRRPP